MIQQVSVPFQQLQIDLWLADLYSISGKEDAARSLLEQVEQTLRESGWHELQRQAAQIAQRLLSQKN
jgi:hypothetical protein